MGAGATAERAMKRAQKLRQKELEADVSEIETRDVCQVERAAAGL
jgi:hypothetical protein